MGKSYEAQLKYEKQIKEGLKIQLLKKDEELTNVKQFNRFLVFFNVGTVLVSLFLVMSVMLNG